MFDIADELDQVRVELRGDVAWITLNRPEKRNAISAGMQRRLHGVLDELAARDVRAVVLTGSGSAFCSGADLGANDEEAGVAADFDRFLAEGAAFFRTLSNFPAPVIAAVNGVALAGGLELMLACDFVIAADSARIGDGHARYGLFPGAGASVRLPRRVGAAFAKYLMFTGDLLPATDLVVHGLVQIVVPADLLDSEADRISQLIASRSPRALAAVKTLVNQSEDVPVDSALHAESLAFRIHLNSPDSSEGTAAWREGRQPNFREL
ncbi:enoyl-CoA hydratase/isomerase family protein [Galbitalea soli]|uniref:Enoyl-CoA hydratase/isomerase family protein n=1 Tax=Galbitalea soli TaxID=1268042 RepID=A0A7C9TQL8_9MICO|nr:enoyl-CoA hydratase/isomerase family protein [Galbitalea soli]NEM91099.1 enoyl-CoA hydratase/isomerase family protein [Galbitalea soli]NYJ29787.1 enoyl-CoA hydratase/carnithine racemase [Galbitalea soli]